MGKRIWVYVLAMVTVAGLAYCGRHEARSGALTLKGSDTMVILSQRWAEKFMATRPKNVIQVTGGGSGTGIAALINGTTDICQASRPMKDAEKQQVQAQTGAPVHEIVVARDGLSIYVPETNPIDSLTLAQIKDLYTGVVTNWKQLGGPDAPVTLYGRENNSGTYVFFKEEVLGGADYAATVQTLPGTAAVVNAVAHDKNGVGYGGAAYAKGVKEAGIKKDAGSPAVRPSEETVRNNTYPLARNLFYYTRKAPEGAMKEFVDYVLTPEGQAIAKEVGYFPAN